MKPVSQNTGEAAEPLPSACRQMRDFELNQQPSTISGEAQSCTRVGTAVCGCAGVRPTLATRPGEPGRRERTGI
jgi:hypothetical protein